MVLMVLCIMTLWSLWLVSTKCSQKKKNDNTSSLPWARLQNTLCMNVASNLCPRFSLQNFALLKHYHARLLWKETSLFTL